MKEPDGEGVASHADSESCAAVREDGGEALTGAHMGRVLSREILLTSGVPTVVEVLNAIYEPAFLGFSYGFRPGRSPHLALDALSVGIMTKKVNWVLDADLSRFFDTLDHGWVVRVLEHRIADRRVVRLIQKWLNAGVLEDGHAHSPSRIGGSPDRRRSCRSSLKSCSGRSSARCCNVGRGVTCSTSMWASTETRLRRDQGAGGVRALRGAGRHADLSRERRRAHARQADPLADRGHRAPPRARNRLRRDGGAVRICTRLVRAGGSPEG